MNLCSQCAATPANFGVMLVEVETSLGKGYLCVGCLGKSIAPVVSAEINVRVKGEPADLAAVVRSSVARAVRRYER